MLSATILNDTLRVKTKNKTGEKAPYCVNTTKHIIHAVN